MNVDFQPHLPNEFIQLSSCMLKKKKKKNTERKKSGLHLIQMYRFRVSLNACNSANSNSGFRNANGSSSDFFFYLNRDEPWLLVSSRDTAKLFCMLDIPKDTPLLLLIYSDLSGFISGYYAKFFFFKMYCLGKNLFNGHEWVYQILFPFCQLFQVYSRMVTLVVCSMSSNNMYSISKSS